MRKKLTRREARDLDIEIGFIKGILRRAPDFLEALQVLGDDYARCGRFDDGLKVDKKLAVLQPADPNVFYNLACSYTLTGRLTAAARALWQALDCGYTDLQSLAEDPDLEALRRHPRYKKIQQRIQTELSPC